MKWLAICLTFVLLASAAACGDSEESLDDPTDTSSPTPVASTPAPPVVTLCFVGQPGCETPEPEPTNLLTFEQTTQALMIMRQDSALMDVLDDAQYTTTFSWWEANEHLTLVAVDVSLEEPLVVDAELPSVDLGFRGGEANPTTIELPPPYYVVTRDHITMDDARSLFVGIDLDRGIVVSVIVAPF